jgi:glycosyltransferase involved in cell wall biosynthesis
MNTYSKRIAFLISAQHLIAHGGLGQFAFGFTKMAKQMNWKVDIISDIALDDNDFIARLKNAGARIGWAQDPLRYSDHSRTFVFGDSPNFEKMANFRKALVGAFNINIYDAIICNSYESMPATYALDLARHVPVIFYTHNESMVFRDGHKVSSEFTKAYNEFYNRLIELPDIIVGTQTLRNEGELKSHNLNAFALPYPATEHDLLEPYYGERSGVLYIGRFEPRKNPLPFIDAVVKTGLPARVLTNKNGGKKFRAEFAKHNFTDYVIGEGLVGAEKVDFIRSSKVHYNPALRESFGLAFWECMGQMPVVAHHNVEWVSNFDPRFYQLTSAKDAPDLIRRLHEEDMDEEEIIARANYVKGMHGASVGAWDAFLLNAPKLKGSSSAKINSYSTFKYADYISDLNRGPILAVDDIKSVYSNRGKYRVIYTDTDTYLTTDANFVVPVESESLEDLFG